MPKINYSKYLGELEFIDEYKKAPNAASGSQFDPNANVECKNVTTLTGELHKEASIGLCRLQMIRKLTEMYGEDVAKEYIRQLEEHEIYKHDESHCVLPYCVSITMYPFICKGLSSIGGPSSAPKNLNSFAGNFVNLIFTVAAQFAGAVATPEFITYTDYFIRKEYGDDYYLHMEDVVNNRSKRKRNIKDTIADVFEQVVYSLNEPAAARNFQSVFWNISYFDKPYFDAIFDGFVFPDGTEPQWESVSFLQKFFMNWFNEERRKTFLTFPVETVNLLYDKETKQYVDKEWADFTAEMWSKGHSFFCYNSDSADSLSSCCFKGDEIIKVTKDSGKTWEVISIKDFCNRFDGGKAEETLVNTGYQTISYNPDTEKCELADINGVLVKKEPSNLLAITSQDGNTVTVTRDHLFGVIDKKNFVKGGRSAQELFLHPHDYLLDFFPSEIDSVKEVENPSSTVYDIQLAKNHWFWANGILTHNCRLKNGITENVFSYTLGAGGISTGSKCVITTNINRLVQEAVSKGEDFSEKMREQAKKNIKYLLAYNEILKEEFNARLLSIYDAGYISLEKQYLTQGVNGFVEAAEFLGIDISPNEEYYGFCRKILSPIMEENKKARTKEVMFNTEFVPKECGYKAA